MNKEMEYDRKEVLKLILENPSLRKKKLQRVEEIERTLRKIRDKEKLDFEIFLGGSYAKGTDIKGSDADIFMLFPHEFDAIEILRILKKEFPDGREEYSDHPYLMLPQDTFSIDIVPGYKASTGSDLKTAVDRTPFHVRFVQKNFSQRMKNEVRILKQFLKGIGVYGAESSVQGLSGYVAELLIYKYGSFDKLITNVRTWKIPCILDHNDKEFRGANIVLVDPVDSGRNTAANVSVENLATFILAAKMFKWENWKEFFYPVNRDFDLPKEAVVIYFPCKRCNEEILIPNLRRISTVLRGELDALGFRVIYSSVFVTNGGYIVLIPEANELGESALHLGPPVTSPNVKSFLEKWRNGTKFGMPFIAGDRICVLREREKREVPEAIAEIVPKIKLAKDFDLNRILVISGSDLDSVPESIRKRFLFPSLGGWAVSQGILSEMIQNPKKDSNDIKKAIR
jgi:tRNA nucleotidyltransferase (CCA-adding enzyme)